MITQAWSTGDRLIGTAASPVGGADQPVALQLLFLLLPIIGIGLVLWSLLRTLIRLAVRRARTRRGTPDAVRDAVGSGAPAAVLTVAYLLWTMSRLSVRRATTEGAAAPRSGL